MIHIKSFIGELKIDKFDQPDLEPIGETKKGPIYRAEHDIWSRFIGTWKVSRKKTATAYFELFIEKGALSDGVSSPGICRAFVTVDGPNRMGGQNHDASYRSKGFSKKIEYRTFLRCDLDYKVTLGRKACDQIYRDFAKAGGSIHYKLAYNMLRMFGWMHFGKKAPGF